ncbi:MAG: zinc-binding alcohol dehydrogenase, partial [Candidatus Eisenbacteria bacterium]|nr:zinc-binding alcohol dehydrogenase [Candidatus Eisenbacteria bacterium]
MKQIVTNKSGELKVLEVPAPGISPGQVLVRTHFSLISAGTEGAQIREGKAGLLTKVKDHPEQVQMVLGKLKKEGIKSVASQVREKLKEWKTLGYSLSGVVIGVGEGVTDLKVGDHVGCGGAGYAVHAEIVSVPKNLVVKIPEGVSMRDASFVTLGTIALHGVREAQPTLGEFALVQGLGLVGQLAVQFLKASGARVAATDLSEERMALAKKLGADLVLPANEDAQASIAAWTGGAGVDMVLVCAATQSSGPLETASKLARDKGRIVVVGDVGMELSRGPFFRKELGFSLS